MDEEAIEKVKQEEIANRNIGILGPGGAGLTSDPSSEQLVEEEKKEAEEAPATGRSAEEAPLPGEVEKPKPQHDSILIACAPYPTNKTHSVLPRYLTKMS